MLYNISLSREQRWQKSQNDWNVHLTAYFKRTVFVICFLIGSKDITVVIWFNLRPLTISISRTLKAWHQTFISLGLGYLIICGLPRCNAIFPQQGKVMLWNTLVSHGWLWPSLAEWLSPDLLQYLSRHVQAWETTITSVLNSVARLGISCKRFHHSGNLKSEKLLLFSC